MDLIRHIAGLLEAKAADDGDAAGISARSPVSRRCAA